MRHYKLVTVTISVTLIVFAVWCCSLLDTQIKPNMMFAYLDTPKNWKFRVQWVGYVSDPEL